MVGAFARSIALGTKNNLPAAEALADKVIGQSFEDEPHARDGKGTKRLARNSLQFDLDGRRRFAMVQAFQRDLACYAGADCAVTVCDFAADREGLALARSGECRLEPLVVYRSICLRAHVALPGPRTHTVYRSCKHAGEIQRTDAASLLEQIGAAHGIAESCEAQSGEHVTQIACEAFEEADDVFGLAAELRAQLGFLGSDAGGAGVEVTLPRHVAANRDEHRGTESKFIRAQHGGDQDIPRGLKATIAAQTHAAAKASARALLRLREAQLPGNACVLDARAAMRRFRRCGRR